MKKIDWVRKLTSRKLWTAVASFVSMMIVATGGAENTATQVTALIMAGASVVAYIIGEGLTDAACIEDETENNRNRGRETALFFDWRKIMDKKQLEILTNIIGGVESGGQVYGQRRYEAYAGKRANSENEKTMHVGLGTELRQ